MLLDYTRPVTKKPLPASVEVDEVMEDKEEDGEDALGEDVAETPSSASSSAAHCGRPNYTKVNVNVNYQTRYTLFLKILETASTLSVPEYRKFLTSSPRFLIGRKIAFWKEIESTVFYYGHRKYFN